MCFIVMLVICLFLCFVVKCIQKQMFFYDVDIIWEQVKQGLFDDLQVVVVVVVVFEGFEGIFMGFLVFLGKMLGRSCKFKYV